jgi:trigger factor
LKLILPPQLLAADSPEEGKSFKFEAELDLKPVVPAIDCSKIEVEAPKKEAVDEEKVDQQLTLIRENFAEYKAPLIERPAKEGDKIQFSYEAFLNNERVPEACSEGEEYRIGKGEILPDFEKILIGMKVFETRSTTVKFEDDHPIAPVRGKELQFKLQLKDLKEAKLPELDDAFIEKINPKTKTVAEFKELLRAELTARAEQEYQSELRNRLSDRLIDQYVFDISPRHKQMTAERILRDHIQGLMKKGMNEEQIKTQSQQMMGEAAMVAERQIRLVYILEQIYRDAKLDVTDADVEERFQKISETTGISVAEIKSYYSQKDEGDDISRMDRIKMELLDQKSLDYALSKARIKTGA